VQETEIELDIDELPNEVLLMLLKYVKKHAPAVLEEEEPEPTPPPTTAPSRPKKNKPMSKYEQEAQINMLQGSLSRFQGGAGSPDPGMSPRSQILPHL
jgi:bromodomain-containing factor 1